MKEGQREVGGKGRARALAVGISSPLGQRPHTILCASYSTLLSSRIARNSLKTLIGGASYPSLKPGGLATHIVAAERRPC
jgi:hypothetical protein